MNPQNGLAADIKSARQKFSDFFRSIFGEKKDFNKVAYMNNPESIGDEMLILFWVVVAVASGFTFYYGFRYHLSIFEGNGDNEALIISTAVFIVGEILKVMVGHRFFRAVFSGLFSKGIAQLLLVIGMGILSYFAYQWSVGISAKGYAAVMANKAKSDAVAKTGDYSAIEKSYNDQIDKAQKTVDAGRKVTWAGKVTWEGQQMIKQGNKIIASLNADKQKAIAAAAAKDVTTLSLSNELILNQETQQNDYGGKAEKVVAFCLLLICLIEVINYRQNQKQVKDAEALKVAAAKQTQQQATASPPAFVPKSAIQQPSFNISRPNISVNQQQSEQLPHTNMRPMPSLRLHAVHEAGHCIAYWILCKRKGVAPKTFRLEISDTDGRLRHFAPANDLNQAQKLFLNMAGFAAEAWVYAPNNRLEYYAEVMNTQSQQSDITTSLEITENKREPIEYAFMEAYIAIEREFQAHRMLYKELFDLRILDAVHLDRIFQRCSQFHAVIEKETSGLRSGLHMPIPTPTLKADKDDPTAGEAAEHFGLDKTVVTPVKTVTTTNNSDNSEFSYGDELLKSMKGNFGAELNNLKTGNGKTETVITRLIAKSKEFDTAVRTVKATPKLRNQICDWVADNVAPVISNFRKANKEGSDE